MTPFDGSVFVATPGNIAVSLIPSYVKTVFLQVASGVGPPGSPIPDDKLAALKARGIQIGAWAWCVGPTQPGGGQPEEEAVHHCVMAKALGAVAFVANMESFYDAGGNQGDVRYHYPTRYLDHLDWHGYLGITTTPLFGSDTSVWSEAGAVYMPQAFPLENKVGVATAVQHGINWGWPAHQQRPLVQTFKTNDAYPDPVLMAAQADALKVGLVPFTLEQSSLFGLAALQDQISRPQGEEEEPVPGTLIGDQDGIKAMFDRLRNLDPGGTKMVRGLDGKWPDLSTLPADLNTWKAYDKAQRALQIVVDDHDANLT